MDAVRRTKGAARTLKARGHEFNSFDDTLLSMQDIIDAGTSILLADDAKKVMDGLKNIMLAIHDPRRPKPAKPTEDQQDGDTAPAT